MRSRRRPARPGLILLLAVAAGCGAGGHPRPEPAAPIRLAYAGRAGDARRWIMEQTWRGQLALGGLPQLVVLTFSGTLEERVEAVAPDGRQRVRLTSDLATPEVNGYPVDPDRAPRHATILFDRAPNGAVTVVSETESEADALAWTARTLAGGAPVLPNGPASPGATWSRAEPLAATGGGSFTATVTGALLRVARGTGGDVAELATTQRLDLASAPTGSPVASLSVDARGTARFDLGAGALLTNEQAGLVVLKGAGRNGVAGRLRFTSTLRPAPESATAP